MLAFRSVLFNALFFGLTFTVGLLALPLFLGPPPLLRRAMHHWAVFLLWLLRTVCGIRVEVSGREHLPAGGAAIVAARHESTFDTIVWFALLPDVAYVMKRELFFLPVYGWYAMRSGHIAVDRAAAMRAMRGLIRDGRVAAQRGRQILIFPEGTRTPPGEHAPMQPGVLALAQATGLPVIPVSTNSGLFWPRRSFLKRPGVLRVAVLPPLHGKQRLLERLGDAIAEGQARL